MLLSALAVILLFMIFVTLIAILVQLRSNQTRRPYPVRPTDQYSFHRQYLNAPTRSTNDPDSR